MFSKFDSRWEIHIWILEVLMVDNIKGNLQGSLNSVTPLAIPLPIDPVERHWCLEVTVASNKGNAAKDLLVEVARLQGWNMDHGTTHQQRFVCWMIAKMCENEQNDVMKQIISDYIV